MKKTKRGNGQTRKERKGRLFNPLSLSLQVFRSGCFQHRIDCRDTLARLPVFMQLPQGRFSLGPGVHTPLYVHGVDLSRFFDPLSSPITVGLYLHFCMYLSVCQHPSVLSICLPLCLSVNLCLPVSVDPCLCVNLSVCGLGVVLDLYLSLVVGCLSVCVSTRP